MLKSLHGRICKCLLQHDPTVFIQQMLGRQLLQSLNSLSWGLSLLELLLKSSPELPDKCILRKEDKKLDSSSCSVNSHYERSSSFQQKFVVWALASHWRHPVFPTLVYLSASIPVSLLCNWPVFQARGQRVIPSSLWVFIHWRTMCGRRVAAGDAQYSTSLMRKDGNGKIYTVSERTEQCPNANEHTCTHKTRYSSADRCSLHWYIPSSLFLASFHHDEVSLSRTLNLYQLQKCYALSNPDL